MFLNVIFVILFLLVATTSGFSQESGNNTLVAENTINEASQQQVVDTASSETTVQGGSFFDILPVDENGTQQNQTQPAFLNDLQNRDTDNNITATFVRAIVGLIFFFAALYIAYRYLKNRSKNVLGSTDIIKVLATTALAQNKSLSIVEIVDNIYFISTTDKSITMMSEITDKDTKDAIRIAYAKSSENVVEEPFSSMFDKALSMLNIKKDKADKEAIETTKEMTEKIRTMNNDVETYLNNQDEATNNNNYGNTTISFDKINRYVENDAVGNNKNALLDEDSDGNDIVQSSVDKVPKKRVSKKTSKK